MNTDYLPEQQQTEISYLNSINRWIFVMEIRCFITETKIKLRGFSPQANYTDRANAACKRS
jgi:hypothetical protein